MSFILLLDFSKHFFKVNLVLYKRSRDVKLLQTVRKRNLCLPHSRTLVFLRRLNFVRSTEQARVLKYQFQENFR